MSRRIGVEITWVVENGAAPHTFEVDPAGLVGMDEDDAREHVREMADEQMMETLFPTIAGGLEAAMAAAALLAADAPGVR